MTASNSLICFLVWPLPETAKGILQYVTVSWMPYQVNTTVRDAIAPLVRSSGCPPRTKDLTRPPAMATAKNKK